MRSNIFDPQLREYDAIRLARKKKMLTRSIIPTVITVLIAFWFIAPIILTHFAVGKYKSNDYPASRSIFNPLTWSSPERFVIEFNTGTVDTKLGNYDKAESELTKALAISPPDKKCMVAQNLVFSHKARVESLKATDNSQSTVYDNKAKEVMAENEACFKGSAASGGGSSSSSSAAQDQSPTDAQQQQLQQKEQEGRERQEQFARKEEFDPSKPELKPW